MLLQEQQAPFVLTAMTLRGIGSYLHGARLEIRPLTIICGKNGSGKSTWLKVLNLLSRSLRANRLPFGFDIADWDPDNIQLTNAFYHLASVEDHANVADAAATAEYGPPGTIGLEFRAMRDIAFSATEYYKGDFVRGHPREFLWLGRCPAGTRFRVRIAHPTYWSDGTLTPELVDLVELQMDGTHLISFEGERDSLQKFEEGLARPRRSKPYDVICSEVFIPSSDVPSNEVVRVGSVTDLPNLQCVAPSNDGEESADASFVKSFVEVFDTRIRELLLAVLAGYFYVGAVRQPQLAISLASYTPEEIRSLPEKRYVGPAGEHAWLLERCFASNPVRPFCLERFRPEYIQGIKCLRLLGAGPAPADERLAHIWELASEESRANVRRLRESDVDEPTAAEAVAEVLNNVLLRRDLFIRDLWRSEDEFQDPETGEVWYETWFNDPEVDHYSHQDITTIPQQELERLNYLLIRDALRRVECITEEGNDYQFEQYVSRWMSKLTDAGLAMALRDDFHRMGQWVWGFEADHGRTRFQEGFLLCRTPAVPVGEPFDGRLQRLTHPCFGRLEGGYLTVVVQPPRQLSSGFHQVFPIIVQLGLSTKGELVGIENPEVHLHPALQLQMTEALLAHAAVGRTILVETHSDLVIRRVIRAILEEQVPQTAIQVYFADVSDGSTVCCGNPAIRFHYSTLTPFRINERGRIANWPEGFLDDDVRESQRLLDVMYGGTAEEEDDE